MMDVVAGRVNGAGRVTVGILHFATSRMVRRAI
jgi:hypothetical protein